ncbi:hypothetical protein LV84_04141 [Algoriphagus ratkowskyi]|uniref:DUF3990 domain-containing protein n=1 Tax=Algoriphagus ratkowskyi TaxID=57028 RepID=A0A2W7QPN2_9BACT|nr:hypothetical protein [Algoriphagus ratkowskyi]PZX49951.1 hypothetical protein LV84_04141 [Algoriphagus ratkowskyi]TXD75522.1 hypothetical protein ESW18_20130 [Algoriphagus ratkowskyi]
MYDVRPNFIIGFHGCEESVRDKLINHPNKIINSNKPYDWLGNGMYFWENNYTRAQLWAEEKEISGKITKPAVLGAVIHLGYCCDFLDSKYIQLIQNYYTAFKDLSEILGDDLPKNKDVPSDYNGDMLLRNLDCAVIEHMHQRILENWKKEIEKNGNSSIRNFDTTRGVFTEGGPAFEGAGLFEKSHIQVCVRNANCIKGFFIPREEIEFPTIEK